MYAQLDLEVRCKRPKKRKDHLIFINFGENEVHTKKHPQKKNFDV
jgi:hypothetical protein